MQGPASNWIICAVADGIILIDAGYPADMRLVLESIVAAGHQPSSLRRIYLTHGHVDHIGAVPALIRQFPDVEVLTHPDEIANVRGPRRQQVTVGDFGGRLASFRVLRWLVGVIRSDGLRRTVIPTVRAWDERSLSGDRLEVIPTPGHTDGSSMIRLIGAGAIATGDAVITHHHIQPTRWHPRPRMIPAVFSADADRAFASVATHDFCEAILPGHGPAMRRSDGEWHQVS